MRNKFPVSRQALKLSGMNRKGQSVAVARLPCCVTTDHHEVPWEGFRGWHEITAAIIALESYREIPYMIEVCDGTGDFTVR